jgi:hypothetical protein
MGNSSVAYEPYARWLAREQIGPCMRKRYPVSQLPPRLLTLVRKLEAAQGNQLSQAPVGELDATEDSHLA